MAAVGQPANRSCGAGGAAGEGWVFSKTARVFQCHPWHTQGKRAELERPPPGRREAGQARMQGLVLFLYTLAKVWISLLFPWIFRVLTSRNHLCWLGERRTWASLQSLGKWGCWVRGDRDTSQRGQHRCDQGPVVLDLEKHLRACSWVVGKVPSDDAALDRALRAGDPQV